MLFIALHWDQSKSLRIASHFSLFDYQTIRINTIVDSIIPFALRVSAVLKEHRGALRKGYARMNAGIALTGMYLQHALTGTR
jgi:predicted membrane channel-forming protein YqfA (hemolysin III family)